MADDAVSFRSHFLTKYYIRFLKTALLVWLRERKSFFMKSNIQMSALGARQFFSKATVYFK